MRTVLKSSVCFDAPDPEGFLARCAREIETLNCPYPGSGRPAAAALDGVWLSLSVQQGRVRIGLESRMGDALTTVRAGVRAVLERLDPGLGGLGWDGEGRPGDLPSNFSAARVDAMQILSDDFVRLELQGNDLARFARGGLHFRILRQLDPARKPAWPRLAENGSVDWPENGDQLFHRAYTGRYVDEARHRITVDILRHDGGPTAAWAESNPVGELIGLTGPGGSDLPEGGWMLLAGDETAQPAILRMLETLPPETEGEALVMAGAPGREGRVENRTGIRLRWLYRDRGDDLIAAAQAVRVPDRPDRFLWFAASKPEAREMRRYFKDTLGQDRSRLTAGGYWE